MNILDVTTDPYIDSTITNLQLHSYQPSVSGSFEYNDEVRIPIQEVDLCTLPCESHLYIEGKLTKDDGTKASKLHFINNGIAFLFREIRYELNGVTVDTNRNVGLTSTLKAYLSYTDNESIKLHNAGWFPKLHKGTEKITDDAGNFNVCIPLNMLMGFFEDYKKIIINMKQELVLVRANNDLDSITSNDDTEKPKVTINKIFWRVPHVSVDIPQQLALTEIIDRNTDITLAFRSWELIEYPSLSETTHHSWNVRTTSKLETPRNVIVAFHNNKKHTIKSNMSWFDNINLSNIRIFLNGDRYPYQDLNVNFKTKKFASLYEMFSNFRHSYYETTKEPIYTPEEYLTICPIVHIDCSRQKESVQGGSVVMRIEIDTSENVPKDTTAYCLILHDKLFNYNPLTKIVQQR